MEIRDDQSKRPQSQPEPPKKPKSRLERWIEKLEERIAPCQTAHDNDYCAHRGQGHNK